jgi:hypothetical protein
VNFYNAGVLCSSNSEDWLQKGLDESLSFKLRSNLAENFYSRNGVFVKSIPDGARRHPDGGERGRKQDVGLSSAGKFLLLVEGFDDVGLLATRPGRQAN